MVASCICEVLGALCTRWRGFQNRKKKWSLDFAPFLFLLICISGSKKSKAYYSAGRLQISPRHDQLKASATPIYDHRISPYYGRFKGHMLKQSSIIHSGTTLRGILGTPGPIGKALPTDRRGPHTYEHSIYPVFCIF